jgi:hypothetical protein
MTAQLTRSQAAKVLRGSVATVRRLEQSGALPFVVDAKGVHRFALEDVQRVAGERGRPLPKPHEHHDSERRPLELPGAVVGQLVALGCGDERGELTPASLVATVQRLRERLRHLRAELRSASTTTGSDANRTPRPARNSTSAASTTRETLPSASRPANVTTSA